MKVKRQLIGVSIVLLGAGLAVGAGPATAGQQVFADSNQAGTVTLSDTGVLRRYLARGGLRMVMPPPDSVGADGFGRRLSADGLSDQLGQWQQGGGQWSPATIVMPGKAYYDLPPTQYSNSVEWIGNGRH